MPPGGGGVAPPAGGGDGGVAPPAGGGGGRENLPPPPPQLAEVMANQTRLLEALAEGVLRRNAPPPADFQRKLEGFMKLKPPEFDSSDDPIDAADWLSEVERKLDLTTCSDEECVGVAAH